MNHRYNIGTMLIYLIKGGPVMIPIGLCSIAAGTFVIVQWIRIWEISQNHSESLAQIEQAIQKRDWSRALQVCEQRNHPFLKAWRTIFILLMDAKSDLQGMQEEVAIECEKLIAQLESALHPLGAMVTVLPMLGFLGTIVGLISSFQNWEQMGAQVSISALSAGIYQAMITTAAGLITAIPYYLIHHYFTVRSQAIALNLSKETTQLFRLIKDTLLREIPMDSSSFLNTTS